MKKQGVFAGSLALALTATLFATAQPGHAGFWGRGDDHEKHGEYGEHEQGVKPVTDPVVLKECGACHMAFQPGWLPARSWERIMGSLNDHFGDNASLDPGTVQTITAYLTANAADAASRGRGGNGSDKESAAPPPLRITELPWFRAKHEKRGRVSPEALKRRNAKSKADCKACHPGADKGFFEDD